MPETIGYLKAIGLDYGYGPTATIEWILEHMHVMGGLPWWGAIAATAVLIRVVTFPLYLKSADQAARASALISVTKPLQDQMKAAQEAGDQTGVMQAWTQINAVRKRAGLSYMQQFTPMLVQAVLGFCSFKLMRAMSALPVPGLQTGGFGWVTDLTVSDGYLLLPALMAGSMHIMFRYGGETGQTEMLAPAMRNFMLWGAPALVFVMTGWQTAAVCIWFVASGGWAMGQAMLMQKPAVRKFFGVTPMYKSSKKQETQTSLMDVVMGSTKSKTIDTTATVKKSLAYQAPNIRTTTARGAPVSKPEAPVAPAQQESAVNSLKKRWTGFKTEVNEHRAKSSENKARKTAAETAAKNAADHEKRAMEKKKRMQRGGQ
jgi:YidC/Oxa1 family membrane protein insertase